MKTTSIGEIRPDGSILLYDENIKFRADMTTPRRIQPSAVQKQQLAEWGLQWVRSSFISAVGYLDNDLYIRFWNGSYYVYYGFADHYDKILQAISKGRYFIQNIRPTKSYDKLGDLPLPQDLKIDDTSLFKAIEQEYNAVILEMYKRGTHEIIYDKETQREFLKVTFAGETIYLAINNTAWLSFKLI